MAYRPPDNTPPGNIPPDDVPPTTPRRRPFYYPAGLGCLFWVFIVLAFYLLIGLLWRSTPGWYPWWW